MKYSVKHLFPRGFPLCLCMMLAACASKPPATLYQSSTINALLDGAYDGDVRFSELQKHGNFGLGTFSHLDGEMVALDGNFYQVKSDGHVYAVSPDTLTPFSCVLFFNPTAHAVFPQPLSYADLKSQISSVLKNPNSPYAIRIDGTFTAITVRSVPRQSPPYRRLVEVAKTQSVFEYKKVSGTLVGFWFPSYLSTLNVSDFHFHFISDDRSIGGHVLSCSPQSIHISTQEITGLFQHFPQNEEFRKADLSTNAADVRAVEQAK